MTPEIVDNNISVCYFLSSHLTDKFSTGTSESICPVDVGMSGAAVFVATILHWHQGPASMSLEYVLSMSGWFSRNPSDLQTHCGSARASSLKDSGYMVLSYSSVKTVIGGLPRLHLVYNSRF